MRIRLYKHTLRVLGDPEYIQFLINPDIQKIAVRGSVATDFSSQKIYWTVLKDNRQCCEFYSKCFLKAIQLHFFEPDDKHTYRIVGEYSVGRNTVIFDLSRSEAIPYEEEAAK